MFGETTIFYITIWNHPIETTIYKWLFGVPGQYISHLQPRMELKVMGSGHLAASGDLQKMPQILGDRKLPVNLQGIIYQCLNLLIFWVVLVWTIHYIQKILEKKLMIRNHHDFLGGVRRTTTCDNSWGSGSWPCRQSQPLVGCFWGIGFLAGGSKENLYDYWALKTLGKCDLDFFNCAG